jgi:hypothetical protein
MQFLAEGFGALWALCVGNPDHSDLVVYNKTMLESIRAGFVYGNEKVALGCLGLVVDCIAGATKHKIDAIVEAGIHDLIKMTIDRYPPPPSPYPQTYPPTSSPFHTKFLFCPKT